METLNTVSYEDGLETPDFSNGASVTIERDYRGEPYVRIETLEGVYREENLIEYSHFRGTDFPEAYNDFPEPSIETNQDRQLRERNRYDKIRAFGRHPAQNPGINVR